MQSDANLLPMRGNSVREILQNDHEVIKGLLNSLTHSAADATPTQILEQLKVALTIHNAMEENLIYPALNEIAGQKFDAMKLYNETASADMLVFEIDMMLKEGDKEKFTAKAQKLQTAVFKHIEAEEKSAMPLLEEGADSEETQMLLQSVRDFRAALQFNAPSVPAGRTHTGEISSGSAAQTSKRTT